MKLPNMLQMLSLGRVSC